MSGINSEIVPKMAKELVGTRQQFSGGVFSSNKAIEPTEFDILDWRWGSAQIWDMKKMKPKYPTVEFLVKNESMSRSRWTKGFPCEEFPIEEEDDE